MRARGREKVKRTQRNNQKGEKRNGSEQKHKNKIVCDKIITSNGNGNSNDDRIFHILSH